MNPPRNENQNQRLLHGGQPSVLASLRRFAPTRPVSFQTALAVAERQAEEFLRLSGIDPRMAQPVPTSLVENLPRFRVIREDIVESGMTQRAGGVWLIVLNRREARVRNRFTTFHEFKHALDHHAGKHLYTGRHWLAGDERRADAARQRERAADYFAGCVLMPRAAVLALWREGVREPEAVAGAFDVSAAAARVRLEQIGLLRPSWVCTRGLDPNLSVHDLPSRPPWPGRFDTMRALGLRDPRRAVRRTHVGVALAGRTT